MGGNDKVGIVLLDACRDNPFSQSLARSLGTRSTQVQKGLAPVSTPAGGLLVGFATAPGDVARDGEGTPHSPFTAALLKHLPTPGLEIQQVMTRVKAEVITLTNNEQRPWHNSDLARDVFLMDTQQRSATSAPGERIGPQAPSDTTDLETSLPPLENKETESSSLSQEGNTALSDWPRIPSQSSPGSSTDVPIPQRRPNDAGDKINSRILRESMSPDEIAQLRITAPTKPAETPSTTSQQAYLYEEGAPRTGASRDNATIIWSLDKQPPADSHPPEPVIKGRFKVPGRGLVMDVVIKRNIDKALSASHIIELIFQTPPDYSGGGIDTVARFVSKGNEQARGEGLVAVPVKIDTGYFLIALNNLPQAAATNKRLLLESNWIDIPVGYTTGQRALVTLEKGATGKKVFLEAFEDWERRNVSSILEPRKVETSKSVALPIVPKEPAGTTVLAKKPEPQASANDEWAVQLASQRSAEDATAAFENLKRRHFRILGNSNVDVQKTDVVGKGTFYRVRILANSKEDAIALCERLKRDGGSCFIVK